MRSNVKAVQRRSLLGWVVVTCLLILILLLVLGIWFSGPSNSDWQSDYFDYGKPTPLAPGAPLRDAFCAIRTDFNSLPERLIESHRHHPAWSERRLAAGRFDYRAVQELVLAEQAYLFTRRHSRAEIVAALAPLMALPEGGRAAVVLAGMPSRSKAALRYTTSLAKEMARLYRADDTGQLPLDEQAIQTGPPLSLYGTTNMGNRLERPMRRSRGDSFESRLEPILEDRSRLPQLPVVTPRIEPNSPFRGKRSTTAAVLAAMQQPVPDPRLIDFVEAHSREDLLIALFPYVARAQQGSADLAALIWASDLQSSHWPLAVSAPALVEGTVTELRSRFAQELLALCE